MSKTVFVNLSVQVEAQDVDGSLHVRLAGAITRLPNGRLILLTEDIDTEDGTLEQMAMGGWDLASSLLLTQMEAEGLEALYEHQLEAEEEKARNALHPHQRG